MSEAKHTRGRLQATPWGNSDCSGWDLTINAHLLPLSDASSATEDEAEANARRLVACWNACDGIATDALETEGNAALGWSRTASKLIRAATRSDELLEALQSIAECCNEDHAARDYASRQTEIRGIARAALAKVGSTA